MSTELQERNARVKAKVDRLQMIFESEEFFCPVCGRNPGYTAFANLGNAEPGQDSPKHFGWIPGNQSCLHLADKADALYDQIEAEPD